MNYAVQIAYEGSYFAGWQVQPQPDLLTGQGVLQKALSVLEGAPVKVTAAGRTDSGVHARGQVASFQLSRIWDSYTLMKAINANLGNHISVIRAASVSDNFNARRSALWREYSYFVWHHQSCYPHLSPFVWWRNQNNWNDEIVHKCCAILHGRHDFSAFCRVSECPENPFRDLMRVRYIRKGNLSVFRIRGTAFLTNMIRIIVGNIDTVARGEHDIAWLEELLEGKSRIYSAATAPATGLFFWRVGYNDF